MADLIATKHDFLIHLHLLGPSGDMETLAFQARVFRLGFQHLPRGSADVSAKIGMNALPDSLNFLCLTC